MKYLRNPVEVGDEHGLQDDTHVRCEEQFDRQLLNISTIFLTDEFDIGLEALQVDEDYEYKKGSG